MSELLDALSPRLCACGEPTGSIALDLCPGCERAQAAVDAYLLATSEDQP